MNNPLIANIKYPRLPGKSFDITKIIDINAIENKPIKYIIIIFFIYYILTTPLSFYNHLLQNLFCKF